MHEHRFKHLHTNTHTHMHMYIDKNNTHVLINKSFQNRLKILYEVNIHCTLKKYYNR